MNDLVLDLKKAADFVEKYSNIAESTDFFKIKSSLEKALEKFLEKSEKAELDFQPLYRELFSFLLKSKKPVITLDFMKSFAKKELKTDFPLEKSDKKVSKKICEEFLKLTAKLNKLEELKKQIDPDKPLRDQFQELVNLDIQEIEKQLSAMKPKELSELLEAGSIEFGKIENGELIQSEASWAKILSEIKNLKQSEHYSKTGYSVSSDKKTVEELFNPDKPLREKFQELLNLDIKEIEKQLSAMKPKLKELSALLEAGGIEFDKTTTGKLSTKKASWDKILSEIEKRK